MELEPTTQATDQDTSEGTGYEAEGVQPDGSSLLNHTEQAEVEQSQEPGQLLEIERFGGRARKPVRICQPTISVCCQTELSGDGSGDANPYAPFLSQTDWEVEKWGKLCGSTSTVFIELLEIPGVSSGLTAQTEEAI